MKQTIIIMWLITSLAYATDFDESLKLAKEGDAEAQFEAGRTYYSGRSLAAPSCWSQIELEGAKEFQIGTCCQKSQGLGSLLFFFLVKGYWLLLYLDRAGGYSFL